LGQRCRCQLDLGARDVALRHPKPAP
jgi:hypothetical protein